MYHGCRSAAVLRYSSAGGHSLDLCGLRHRDLSRCVSYPVDRPDSIRVGNVLIPIEKLKDHGKSDHDESNRHPRNVKHRSHAGSRMRLAGHSPATTCRRTYACLSLGFLLQRSNAGTREA